ncbi:MAG: hypothetical protein IIZ56_02040 [Clostridia bacterium]|nr:hypothetical protein [Clostridia bacterium]
MAQRLLHYLIGERLISSALAHPSAEDAARFRLGNLLPDAYPPGRANELRKTTHFIVRLSETEPVQKCSDFERFRRMFRQRIPLDGLYLGYYLHLVSDACYRRLFYASVTDAFAQTAENISFLHRDYHILNALIVRKFKLENALLVCPSVENEPIMAIAPFDAAGIVSALDDDFKENTAGELRYLAPELPEKFIEYALPVCLEALEGLLSGSPMDPASLTWRRNK